MAISIVATVGSATANSFVTEAETDTYLEARLNAGAWNNEADGERRRAALVEATRTVSDLSFKGFRTDSIQSLSWPRAGVPNPDAAGDATLGEITGEPEYADDVIPVRVKEATIELALEFLRAGATDIAGQDANQGVKRKKIDVLETEWFAHVKPGGISRFDRVISRIAPLLSNAGRQVVRT